MVSARRSRVEVPHEEAAAFKISFARRNSSISARSRRNSADSSLCTPPARVPASTSARRTHLRSVSADTFTFAATGEIVSHYEACPLTCYTNANARSRTSRGASKTGPSLHPSQRRVGLDQVKDLAAELRRIASGHADLSSRDHQHDSPVTRLRRTRDTSEPAPDPRRFTQAVQSLTDVALRSHIGHEKDTTRQEIERVSLHDRDFGDRGGK